MDSVYGNLDHIVTVRIMDERPNDMYEYVVEERKKKIYQKWYHWFIGKFEVKKENLVGWRYKGYYVDEYKVYTEDDLKREGFLVNGFKVYHKPSVYITFVNKQSVTLEFVNYDETLKSIEPILGRRTNIMLIKE